MLKRLRIENYGLIESAEINFAPGATIFTGETGSGKTMLLGALAFALGARSGPDAVRRSAQRSAITLTFEPEEPLRKRFNSDGFTLDPGEEATLLREMTHAGKSSVSLNGRPATAGYVREIAADICEIVGQHEAQRLLTPAYHLDLLDRFAGAKALAMREAVAREYERVTELREQLVAMHEQEKTAIERFDEARYALDEIVACAPEMGEDDRLTMRRRYLDNVERIAVALRGAHEALAGEDAGATGAFGSANAALTGVAHVSSDLGEMVQQLSALQSETNDLAVRIARELDATEFDPRELEEINTRLDALDRLKRKYGGTLEAVLEHAREAERLVGEHERRDERGAELAVAVASAERQLAESAARLSALRTAAAKALAKRVTAELADLAMGSARFDAALDPLETIGLTGAERVEFRFSANAGEEVRPLSRVASGGELSRLLLALVVVLADAREKTALVFDEIDAGIGGATAVAVGTRIGRLARTGQVVCVTHVPALATWADYHFVLEKSERRGATTINVREVETDEERVAEIARMLSGESHATALKHAREMLSRTRS